MGDNKLTVNGNVLRGAHEDEEEPPAREAPDAGLSVAAGARHHLLDPSSQPDHAHAGQHLDRQYPASPPPEFGTPDGIDDGAPEQL